MRTAGTWRGQRTRCPRVRGSFPGELEQGASLSLPLGEAGLVLQKNKSVKSIPAPVVFKFYSLPLDADTQWALSKYWLNADGRRRGGLQWGGIERLTSRGQGYTWEKMTWSRALTQHDFLSLYFLSLLSLFHSLLVDSLFFLVYDKEHSSLS